MTMLEQQDNAYDDDYLPPAVTVDLAEPTEQTPAAATDRSVALLGRDQQVQVERKKLAEEHAKADLHVRILNVGVRDIDKDIEKAKAAGDDDKVIDLEITRDKLVGWQTEAETKRDKAKKDLDIIESPGSSPAAINQLLARRGAATSSPRQTMSMESDPTWIDLRASVIQGAKLDEKSDETSWTVAGMAGTETKSSSRAIGPGGLSVTDKSSQTTTITGGDSSASKTTSKSETIGVLSGYDRTSEEKEETVDGDATTSTSTKKTVGVGLGGVSTGTTTTTQAGDYQIKDEKGTKVTRGDGKVGVTRTSATTTGTVDGDGNLTSGSKTSSEVGGFVKADKDGVGAGGNAKVGRDVQHSENVKTSTSLACDGHVIVTVTPYEGESEASKGKFVVTVSIKLAAGVTAGGQLGKDSGPRAGADVSAKGSVVGAASHVMTDAEVKAYLADLGGVTKENAGNGKHPEFAQIAAAWRSGWSSDGMSMHLRPDPEQMKEGDHYEVTVAGSVDAKGSAGANAGIFEAGVEGGVTKGGSLKFAYDMVNGKYMISVKVVGEEGWNAGGSLGAAGVKGKVGHEESTTNERGATFYLDPKSTKYSYAAVRGEIEAARTRADLEGLIAKYPALLEANEESTSETEKTTVGLEVGKVGFEMGGSGTVSQKLETDKDGKQSQTDTGSSSSMGKVKIGDFSVGDSKTESITTKVDADNKATGDLSTTESGTDVKKTLLEADDRVNQSGWLPVVTGGVKPVDSTEQSGMLLSNEDYDAIIGEANDPVRWSKHPSSNRHRDDWKQLGRDIRAAGGNKKKVGELLAKFQGDSDHGRAELIANVVRKPLGDGTGGTMYDFPDGLGQLKSKYKSLVFDDPGTKARALKQEGKTNEAATEAKAKIAALDSLWTSLSSSAKAFEESGKIGAYGEMLNRINKRKQELSDEFLNESEAEKARKRYNDLIDNCSRYKQQEDAAYQRIVELDGDDAIEKVRIENELRALYLKFDPDYAEMAGLGSTWGFDENNWKKYKPDKHKWKQSHDQNVNPVGKSDEEQFADKIAEDSNREMTERLRQTSSFSIEAKAAAQQRQFASDREKAAAAQRGPIAKAKNAAALAAAWHNRAMKDGAHVPAAAQQKAGEGWSKWAKAVEKEQTFERVAKDASGMDVAVNMHATNAIALFDEAKALFEKGKALYSAGG
jgi:hypothetical protein